MRVYLHLRRELVLSQLPGAAGANRTTVWLTLAGAGDGKAALTADAVQALAQAVGQACLLAASRIMPDVVARLGAVLAGNSRTCLCPFLICNLNNDIHVLMPWL